MMNDQLSMPMLGPAGIPPTKRQKIDSTASDASDIGKLLEFSNDLPDELELMGELTLPGLKSTDTALLNTELNSTPQPPSHAQPSSQQNPTQPQQGGVSAPGSGFSGQLASNPNTTINMYTNSPQMNSPRFAGLNTSGSAPSPQPTSISTSADPTPALPTISSTPAHSTPATITTTTTSSPLQTSESLQRTNTFYSSSGMMHSSPSSLPQMATAVNSTPPNAMLSGGGQTMIHHGMSHTPNQHPMGNPHPSMGPMQHAVMSGQRGMAHPGMTSNQYAMRQGMGMPHGGMVSNQPGMRYPGMSSNQPVAPGMTNAQMRMVNPSPRMGNPQNYNLAHPGMGPHMSGGMVRNQMMNSGMAPGQSMNPGMPMGPRQPPGMGNPHMMTGGMRQPLPSNNPVGPPFQDNLLSSLDPLRTPSDFGGLGQPQTVHTLPNQAVAQPQPQPQPQQNESSAFGSQLPSSAAQPSSLPSGAAPSSSPQQQQPQQQTSSSPLQGSVAPTLPQSQPTQPQTSAPSQLPGTQQPQLPGQLGPPPGGPMPQQSGVGSPGPPGGQTSDPEKRKLIQQQLVLLLHAHKCQRRERDHQVSGGPDFRPCTLPHCRTMKGVLNHMTECQAGRSCTYPHCASSRQIITHWRNCLRPDCPVCLPLKHASLQHKRDNQPVGLGLMSGMPGRPMGPGGMGGPGQPVGGAHSQGMQPQRPPMMVAGQPHPIGGTPGGQFNNHLGPASVSMPGDLNRPNSMPYSSQVPTPPTAGGMRPPDYFAQLTQNPGAGIPADLAQQSRMPYPLPIPNITGQPTRAQPWHQHVNPDLRQHLVRKLVEAIYPVSDPVALQDRRVTSLIQYAMKVEKAMFETATSREEYYQLLAEKIYRIRKELEQRRMMKSAMENKRQLGGLPGEPGMPNGEPMQPFFGGQQPGGDGRISLPPTPLGSGSQAIPSVGSGSPKPPSSVDLHQPPFALPPTPTSNMDGDKKKDIVLNRQHSKLMSPTSVPHSRSQPPSDQKPPGGIPSVKNEVKSEHSPAPPSAPTSVRKPLLDGSGMGEAGLSDQPYPSVSGVTTPSQFSATSVKVPPSSVKGTEPYSETPLAGSRPSTPGMEVEPNASPMVQKQTKIQPDPALRKVFTREELDLALRPILDAVWNQDPESYPFRQPVDPKSLGIPDYFEIIRHPMDLGTMHRKLEEGEYKNPWEFCKDMWLTFDNAWLYNKKTSRVYKYCSKLSEVFDQYIDDAMRSLGYCCGRRHTFHPQVLYCYGKPLCTIPRDTCYYGHKNRFGKYVYCPKCFFEIPGDSISVGDDPMTATNIPKNAFKELKNDSIDYEEMVECIHCGREVHKICVLHHDQIWPDGYQCNKCLKAKGLTRKESKFSAKRLPTTKLSTFLEDRVNNFLRMKDTDAGEITIRVVSSSDKTLDTRTNMKERFSGEFPEQFPFRTKAMFVFEEIDGTDVCFFGMHVQEYGSDCQAPNTRRVYISYLDSVHFFRPRHLRTQVYHEILIGYLQFCKDNGFLTAHIWACPPSEGDDYIFHCHPVEQKIPKPKRLVEWYKKMLDTGKEVGVVWDYQDIFKACTDDEITSVTEIPYFDGDFWPNVIEETIKELDQEAREREASEQATGDGRGPKKAGKRSTTKKGNKKAGSTRSKSSKLGSRTLIGGDDLSQKIYQTMEKHKEVFFVVTLQPPAAVVSSPLPGTTDPDQLIQCDLMDGRDAFLTMARERHWEFSSLRRARYSTMAMLYELHNQSGDRFVYTCNHCRNHVETRYHCKECDDFDLCVVCYKDVGHIHPMEKLGLGLDDDTTSQDQRVTDPKEQRMAQIQKCIQFLIHASKCRDPTCKQPSCIRMKRVLRHTRDCKLRMSGNCSICKQFLLLCYSHARTCTEDKCPVPVCARIKKTFREQQMQRRRQNERFQQQRMANMIQLNTSNNGTSSQHTPSPVAHTSPSGGTKIPTPPSKGSPAPTPAVSNPAAVAASPIAPRSVGKGGPRTPGKANTPQPPPSNRMVVPPPASLQQAANNVPPAFSKPEVSIPAPNVTVSQSSALNFSGEMPITRVPQPQQSMVNTQVQQVLNALRSNPMDREKAMQFMKSNPEVMTRVMHIVQQSKEQRDMMSIPQDIMHQPSPAGAYQPLPPSGMPQVQPQQGTMMMPSRPQQPMMYSSQQQTMMRPTMVQQHPSYHGAGGQQVPHHTLRPPPQYPSAHGPQTAGYPQVLSQQPRPMVAHAPMAQHMPAPMQHAGHAQYGHPQQYRMGPMQPTQRMVPHQTQMSQMYQSPVNPQQSQLQQMLRQPAQQHYQMGMDPGMQADPSFMYSQHQYGLNSSNNNNSLSQDFHSGLTPQDQLSRFVEKL